MKELLDNRSKVSQFMRPRRFGKTLNLSMLKYYFERPMTRMAMRKNILFFLIQQGTNLPDTWEYFRPSG
ncbi:AAA family ATPase [Eisenbergiella porci]|uniref:AAA family ATPase n=1 Tax=Eisenbergiella porci TaxID=2652274 RepID=UPI002A80CCD6|nr:AAA family ATPase [Eisenbergiella porci]